MRQANRGRQGQTEASWFQAILQLIWFVFWRIMGGRPRHWRAAPYSPKQLFSTLKNGGASYYSALNSFHTYCLRTNIELDTSEDVDCALAKFMSGRLKSQNEALLAAMLKIYLPFAGKPTVVRCLC